jgi:aldehyde:ferredoxin oxidoreductase
MKDETKKGTNESKEERKMADKEKKVSNKPTKGEEKTGNVSRRRFLKSTGLVVGGAAAGIYIGNNSHALAHETPIKDGYGGTVLRVDLTTGKINMEPTTNYEIGKYIGARGLNIKTLYDEVKAGTDALSPENKLILGVGPLVGTRAPSTSRMTITAMSPLCTYGESNIGGLFPIQLKFAGYDQVIISGRSKKPVYLSIVNDKAELKDAAHIWGKGAHEAQDAIIKTADAGTQVISIGPAGENLVRYACIKGTGKNTAGRTGLGAVMGSKNLKAIAARGTGSTELDKPKRFLEINKKLYKGIEAVSDHVNGICATQVPKNFMVDPSLAVIGNYEASSMEGWNNELLDKFDKDYIDKYVGCAKCPIRCYGRTNVPGLPKTIVACFPMGDFSSRLKSTNLVGMVENVTMCNHYGLDATSTGAVIALIYELYDKGILTKEDAEDIPLDRRDKDTVNILMRKIAYREGKIGKLFAEGSVRAAREIGKGAEYYVVHTRGLEPPLADTRIVKGKALSNAVVSRGESTRAFGPPEMSSFDKTPKGLEKHEKAKKQMKELYGTEKAAFHYEYDGKGALISRMDIVTTVYDCVGACKFASDAVLGVFGLDDLLQMLSLATDIDCSEQEVFVAGERTVNLERAFLAREGITRDDDDLGEKLFKEPVPSGPHKGDILERDKFEKMKSDFYKVRGWDVQTGIPGRKKLEELGLDYVADELETILGTSTAKG